MEIEWGWGGVMFQRIKYDYLKLIQARADLRVMVFQGEGVGATMEQLKSIARSFQSSQPGDRYLCAGWAGREQKLHFQRWAL